MKRLLFCSSLTAVVVGFALPARAAVCAPDKLVKITASNVTPGIATGSFAAQPKVYYRIGSDKLRIEEALDDANGIHGLVVVAEPNIWMANLYDNTGKHVVDPGPTFYARAPVFGAILSPKLRSLEFGCEAAFLAANAPKPVSSELVGSDRLDVYRIEDGTDAVELLEQPGRNIPAFARYYQQGNLKMVLRYDSYLTGLPDDPALFTAPSNVRYVETGQH